MSDRDRPKSPPPPPPAADKPAGSGRVQFDERGQAIWEWSVQTGMFDRNASTARIKKLTEAPTDLRLVDDPPPADAPGAPGDAHGRAAPARGAVPGAPRPGAPGAARAPQAKPATLPDRSGGFNPYERVQGERPAPKSRESAGGDPYSRGPSKRPEDVSFNPYERGPGKKK